MPISTLCAKSIPSTCSRKPCTKCCRDCSPSVTTSSPASSCSLIHRSVASALACCNSSPSAFQRGHSLLVSASQPGLGRLPAIVVGNMPVVSCPADAPCLLRWHLTPEDLPAMRALPDPERAKPCVLVIDD